MIKNSLKATFITISISFLIFTNTFAQSERFTCGTDALINEVINTEKGIEQNLKQNLFLKKYVNEVYLPKKGKSNNTYCIPVVVHVIHKYGPENIPDANIYDMITSTNIQLRKNDPDSTLIQFPFDEIHPDLEVELVLAKLDPLGNCTTGITRTVSDETFVGDAGTKSLIGWPSHQYLNIWIVEYANGAGGYSQLPQFTNPTTDGIVLRSVQLSALPHETGHWLGLPHPWGNSNDQNLVSNCNIDDFGTIYPSLLNLDDTPNTRGQSSCTNLTRNSCTTNNSPTTMPGDSLFISIFGDTLYHGEIYDNVQNMMDYAGCDNSTNTNYRAENFTDGQKAIMHAALNSSVAGRNNLWIASNLAATGITSGFTCNPIPIPEFDSQDLEYYFCTGDNVKFENNSYNSDNITYSWSFENGSPSTSTLKEPTVSWNIPGTYQVSLTASSTGGSATSTKTSYIIISANTAAASAPLFETFESSSFPKSIINDDYNWNIKPDASSPNTWEQTTNVGAGGTSSIMIDCRTATGVNQIITPAIDFSNGNCSQLTFDVAYAQRTVSTKDKLKVLVSTNCGGIWKDTDYDVEGSLLSTAAGRVLSTPFVPTGLEWRKETVDLSAYSSEEHLLIMFEHTAQSKGNILYIDNVNVGCGIASINENTSIEFNIYPNPHNEDATIYINSINENSLIVNITDITGRTILNKKYTNIKNEFTLSINKELNIPLNSGVYFINISDGKNIKTQKLIKK